MQVDARTCYKPLERRLQSNRPPHHLTNHRDRLTPVADPSEITSDGPVFRVVRVRRPDGRKNRNPSHSMGRRPEAEPWTSSARNDMRLPLGLRCDPSLLQVGCSDRKLSDHRFRPRSHPLFRRKYPRSRSSDTGIPEKTTCKTLLRYLPKYLLLLGWISCAVLF